MAVDMPITCDGNLQISLCDELAPFEGGILVDVWNGKELFWNTYGKG